MHNCSAACIGERTIKKIPKKKKQEIIRDYKKKHVSYSLPFA